MAPRSSSITGITVARLADRLRDAAARHGCDRAVVPLTALATGTLLLGAPPMLRTMFLRWLADPAHTRDTRRVWQTAAVDYPYLSGSLGPLIGWLDGDAPEHQTTDHQIKALAKCFGALTEIDLAAAAESPGVGGDLLGQVYSLFRGGHSRQRTGAFYTPPDLSHLLAAVTVPRPGDRVYEPACGTGGMVLAAVRHMREKGLDPNSCTWTLNDLDPPAVALAAVNMAAHGVRAVTLTCGDALTDGGRLPPRAAHDLGMSDQQPVPAGAGGGGQFAATTRPANTVRQAEPDEWVSLENPDDPDDLPIYEGPAGAAGQALIPGDSTGLDEDAQPVSVTVRE